MSAQNRRHLRSSKAACKVALGFLYAYSLTHFAFTGIHQALANFQSDFLTAFPCWRAATAMHRLSWYRGSLAEQWTPAPLWNYGPLLHLFTLPLFALPSLWQAYVTWLFVNYAFVVATALLLARVIDADTWRSLSLVVVVMSNFNPLYEALVQRNIEILELLLICGAFLLYRRGRDTSAGVLIGLAAMTKFLPIIFVAYFVAKRRWRAVAGVFAVIVPVAWATERILGWGNSWVWIQLATGSVLQPGTDQSLPSRAAAVAAALHIGSADAVASFVMLVGGVVIGWLLLHMASSGGVPALEWGALATAMVLFPPHNQNYYLTFLLLAYLPLLWRIGRGEVTTSVRTALLILSFILVAAPIPMSILSTLAGTNVFDLYLRYGVPFVGELLLAPVIAAELLKGSRGSGGGLSAPHAPV